MGKTAEERAAYKAEVAERKALKEAQRIKEELRNPGAAQKAKEELKAKQKANTSKIVAGKLADGQGKKGPSLAYLPPFLSMPSDVLMEVLAFLPGRSLGACMIASRYITVAIIPEFKTRLIVERMMFHLNGKDRRVGKSEYKNYNDLVNDTYKKGLECGEMISRKIASMML